MSALGSESPSEFNLKEFTSECDSRVLYYQILHMRGSMYVWVGTEMGEQGCVVAALSARQGVPGTNPSSELISGSGQDAARSCVVRLQARLNYPIFLSLNIPEDLQVLEHVEKTVLDKLSSVNIV